jgi:hypothetical protein
MAPLSPPSYISVVSLDCNPDTMHHRLERRENDTATISPPMEEDRRVRRTGKTAMRALAGLGLAAGLGWMALFGRL